MRVDHGGAVTDCDLCQHNRVANTEQRLAEPHSAWHALTVEEVEDAVGGRPSGLTATEIKNRLERWGLNRIPDEPPTGIFELLVRQFKSPLIYILLLATAVTAVIGDYTDSAVIAAVLALNATIGFIQERRAEKSVRALQRMVSPKARVIRDGHELEIDSEMLVPGDVVLLESGIRVPADIRLLATNALMINEALFTGESVPVAKHPDPVDPDTILAERRCIAYTGSIVTNGRGRGYVVRTGPNTELGGIAEQVRTEEGLQTPLQIRMIRFARFVGFVVVVCSLFAFSIGLALGESVHHMFKVAVALGVAAVPEGLPVVFTITLALGVHRMARRNAIIRHLPAVETLGSTTVIGSDKTGTLTENRMAVMQLWSGDYFEPGDPLMTDSLRLTLIAGIMANEAQLAQSAGDEEVGDPTELALLHAASRSGIDSTTLRKEHPELDTIPFEPDRQYSASYRRYEGAPRVFVKGAPEKILSMCSRMEAAPTLDRQIVLKAAHEMAANGWRVLAMAWGEAEAAPANGDPSQLSFLGLQAMMDPPRPGVKVAIQGCHGSGIRVLMITGDHPATAKSIATALGIADDQDPVTGFEIASMSEEQFEEKVRNANVFARVSPDDKLRIVKSLQRQGEVVGVTGDGVNDAPALKAADIGIAMGKSGTDVAREASDMVLADDNFVSIYNAVHEGRVTFDNLQKATFFLISTGAAAIIVILSALLLGWPIPFLPAQLLWMNLVTNGLQDVALAFEPGEKGVLDRPPRQRDEGIISALLWERTVISGILMAVGTLLLFKWELDQTGSLIRAQTVAVTTLVVFQAFQVGNARANLQSLFTLSPLSNRFLFVSTVGAMSIHVGALYFAPTQMVLRVEPIEFGAWVRVVGTALSIIVIVEAHKAFRRLVPMKEERKPG